jgi:DNA polymerase-3 subunit epsilon
VRPRIGVVKQPPSLGVAVVLDVETTGLSPHNDEILEMALILFRYDRSTGRVVEIVGTYSGLREPLCRIPRVASRVHGITRQAVRGKRLDYRKIRRMAAEADFVVAHNANFDRQFVERLMPSFSRRTWMCSLYGIDWLKRGFPDRSLVGLARAHGIRNTNPHRALGDAKALLALLSSKSRGRRSRLFQLLCSADL